MFSFFTGSSTAVPVAQPVNPEVPAASPPIPEPSSPVIVQPLAQRTVESLSATVSSRPVLELEADKPVSAATVPVVPVKLAAAAVATEPSVDVQSAPASVAAASTRSTSPVLSDDVLRIAAAYRAVQHGTNALLTTIADTGAKITDLALGIFAATREAGPLEVTPVGALLKGALSIRCFVDMALLLPLAKESVSASVGTLLDPSLSTLMELVERTGRVAQAFTRVAYLGSLLGMISFSPTMHLVNLGATGVSGFFGAMGQLQVYRLYLRGKEVAMADGDIEKAKVLVQGQITALLRMAANLSLVAFAVLSATAATCSMIPITAASGTAIAASAGLSILAHLHERLVETPPVLPVAKRKLA